MDSKAKNRLLKAFYNAIPSFKDQIKTVLETSLEHFVKDARVFVDEVVEIVRKRESDPARKVVLIADSLEKIRGSGPQAAVIYATIHETFHGNAANLRFNMLHVVFSVPPTLPLIAPGVGTLYSGGLCGLPQVKVETTPSKAMTKRERFGTGLAMMVELLTRRFPRWGEVFNREQLNRVAYASGGNIRIFFSLIQRVLLKAPRVELPLKDDNLMGHAENDVRAEMLLTDEDKKWLRRVATTHESGLDRLENLGTLGRLCDNHLILDYRNGEPWYDVLPLIRDSLPNDPAP